MDITNFPKAGDDKAVTLRNSEFARFDLGYAETLHEKYPDIWGKGGNIKGNAQFAILSRIVKHGGAPKTRAEEKAVRLREAWAARHFKDHRLPGVVAQIKWLVVGEQGEGAMKKVIEEQKAKDDGRSAARAGGVGETRDLAQRPERRAGDEGESPLYLQQALVRSVRREARPTAKAPDREVVVVEFVASTETLDSHGSVIRSNWDLTRYNKNAVLLWMHGRMNDLPAIGNVENLMKVGSTKHEGNAVFDDTTDFDKAVAAKYEKGVLKGFSIGFYPRDIHFERIDGEDTLVLDDIELLEISCVNVPSNPEALAKSEREALVQIENSASTSWERAIARLSASPAAYDALHKRALAALETIRKAVPFTSYPLKEEGAWDAAAAEKRIKAWATKDGKIDFAKFAKAFAWVNPEKKDTEGGYKLPHHDVDGDKLVTVKAGVIAAGNAIQGSRGGVKIPDADVDTVKSHLARHYKEFGLTPPWERAVNHGARTMSLKTLTIEERNIAHRADKKGVQCEAECPNCNEKMLVKMDHVPVPAEKMAEYEALTARAAKFDADMKAAETAKTTLATERDAAIARTKELENQLSTTRAAIVQTRVDAAEEALKERSGKKLFPTEVGFETELARTYLSDLTPSDKPEHKGRSVGEVKWAERLAMLDARADLGIVTPPATKGDNAEKPHETDKEVRDAAENASQTRVSMSASNEVADLLSKKSNDKKS